MFRGRVQGVGWGRSPVLAVCLIHGFDLTEMFFNCRLLMFGLQHPAAANGIKKTLSFETNDNAESVKTLTVFSDQNCLLDCTIGGDVIHGDWN